MQNTYDFISNMHVPEKDMMRVPTDAQQKQQQQDSPIRMMSGRQLTEHEKIAIRTKWEIVELFTIFTNSDSV